jgi:hypothetical protein
MSTSSTVIEAIRTMQRSGLASLAIFYCDFRDDQKTNLHGIVSSMLVQLCHQSDSYCDILSTFYLNHASGTQDPSDDELVRCLKDVLRLPGRAPIFLIVDGLDECLSIAAIPSPRERVLVLVEDLVGLQLPDLRIFITSRLETDISAVLEPLAFHSLSLHNESGQIEDIENYIKSVVHADPKMQRWGEEDKQLVINILTKNADGM